MRSLTDTELTAVVALASAAVGAAVALISAMLTSRANSKAALVDRAHQSELRLGDITRSKGEELYTLFEKWLNTLAGYFLVRQSVISGKLTYNQSLDIEIKGDDPQKRDFVRIEMLVHVYFPDLIEDYNVVIGYREQVSDIIADHKRMYAAGQPDGGRFMLPFSEAQHHLFAAADRLKQKLIGKLRGA
jgi:hypothetical protein